MLKNRSWIQWKTITSLELEVKNSLSTILVMHKKNWNFFHFDLKLENLQQKRTSLRLVFLYKVVEGLVPAINPSEYLVKSKPKRFDNFESANIVNNSVKNNSKALETTVCNTEQYKNSFFVKSVIHWNQQDEEIVYAKTVESFKTALQHRQYRLCPPSS